MNDNLPLRADASEMAEFDLSEATKLRDVVFRCTKQRVKWISKALHTIRSRSLQRISLELPRRDQAPTGDAIWEAVHQEWVDLDHLLVQFWTSRSLRPTVMYEPGELEEEMRVYVATLLPELTRRGAIDLVRYPPWSKVECTEL